MKEELKELLATAGMLVLWVFIILVVICLLRMASCTVGLGFEEGREMQRRMR